MLIRISSVSVIRLASRTCPNLRLIFGATVFSFACISVLMLMTEDEPNPSSLLQRQGALATWTVNQSLRVEDYLDLNDKESFLLTPKYHRSNETLCGPHVKIMLMVTSAPKNFEGRKAIRETWGKEEAIVPLGVHRYFVLGISTNESINAKLEKEAEVYGDIIQENFIDSYHNLTLKSLALLKWVNLTCDFSKLSGHPDFIFKTDDDMFINVPRLIKVLPQARKHKMLGQLICGAKPVSDYKSKFYMPKYLYPYDKYPGYLSGTGYLIQSSLVPRLLNESSTTPLIHLEDIYVTGLLPRKLHVMPMDSIYFTYGRLSPRDLCPYQLMISSHQIKPKEMYEIIGNLSKNHSCPTSRKRRKWLRKKVDLTKRIRKLCLYEP